MLQSDLERPLGRWGPGGGTCFSRIQKLRAAEALKLAVQATIHPHLWGSGGNTA